MYIYLIYMFVIQIYIYHIFFIHSSVDIHIGGFHILTTVDNAAMKDVHVYKLILSHSATGHLWQQGCRNECLKVTPFQIVI